MPHHAHQYALDVIAGTVTACRWVRLACQRYLDDLRHAKAKGFYFDRYAAERAIEFFRLCPHFQGEWEGRPIELEPWQAFVVWQVFGWKWRGTGERRFKVVYVTVARKNGKTTMVAPVGLYLLWGDDEPGAQVYSVAYNRDQAREVFEAARQMVVMGPLSGRVKAFVRNLSVDETASKFEPLSSDDKSHHGKNIHGALCDELHVWPKAALWSVLRTGMGARRQPIQWAITTAGSDRQSICYEIHQYAQQVLKGTVTDEVFLGLIYTLDRKADWPDLQTESEHEKDPTGTIEDDWRDESCWIKANPNLGISVKVKDLHDEANTAAQMPTAVNDFLRLRMNVWTSQVNRWIPMDLWDRNFSGEIYVKVGEK